MSQTPFRRVLLKISGDSLGPPGERGISMREVSAVAEPIARAAQAGTEIAVVIGGGNILRGASFKAGAASIEEATAHYMGMLATVINGLAFQDAIKATGCPVRLMSAIHMNTVAEPFIRNRALRHLEKKRVVILAGGTGGPFVTTDTAAAQKALELNCQVLLKATRVDGVYSDDPEKNPHAVLYSQLTYRQVLDQNLRVMDRTAVAASMERALPIRVFNFKKAGNIERAVGGELVGTLIHSGEDQ
jgi:uridylate kinase